MMVRIKATGIGYKFCFQNSQLSGLLNPQRKPLEYKTWHHPITSSTVCRMPHLNNKQNKNTNPIIRRQDYHLTHPCPSRKNKQINKNSAQISPYTKLTQTTGPTLGAQNQKEERIQPSSRIEFNFH